MYFMPFLSILSHCHSLGIIPTTSLLPRLPDAPASHWRVKLPELRPTCESFVLIDAINNGYNYNLVKKHIFNASTLNVTLCRYSICNHIKKSSIFSMHVSIGGFKTSANDLSNGLNSNKDQSFFDIIT